MDYAALFAAGVVGMVIGGGIAWSIMRDRIQAVRECAKVDREFADLATKLNHSLAGTLDALRANCFLTNERGHRVRYADASVAVRERAEGGV